MVKMVDTPDLGSGFERSEGSNHSMDTMFWGISSVGRASGLQPEGQEFKSLMLHHNI